MKMANPRLSRVRRILAAQERVELAAEQLFGMPIDDPRFDSVLAEWRNARVKRATVENPEACPQCGASGACHCEDMR
jgi:hypothetical protein